MVEAPGALLAWLGASLIVLADGRRGLALGLLAVGLGMAADLAPSGSGLAVGSVAAAGVIAAAQRLRNGTPGWAIMPPGSTPRLVLCVAAGLLALWMGLVVTGGAEASLRVAVLAVIGMTGVRVLGSREPDVVLSSIAGLALATAAASSLAAGQIRPAVMVGAALIAGASSFIRLTEPSSA